MGGKTDIVKGRLEEAGGVLAGDNKLRNKGKRDQAVGHIKEVARKAVSGGKADIVKGRMEEAGGVLAGNNKLRNKGKRDQAVGHIKEAARKAVDRVSKRLHS